MLRKYRLGLIIFAALGLGASLYALFVHYRLLTDPAYASVCDISATVSCQQVLQSEYSHILGIPVASGGVIWSALVLLLASYGMRKPASAVAQRVAGYIFLLATVGLATVFYFAYTSFFVLKLACPVCMTMYVSVIATFLLSSAAAGSISSVFGGLASDLGSLTSDATSATLAAAWVVASLALIAFFPTQQTVSAQVEQAQPAPVETLTTAQIEEWERWLDAQARAPEVQPTGDAKVLVVKFNDYQCPACRQTYIEYRNIIAKYEQQYPGVFRFETRDFPLESECGFGGIHGGACEAAVAVRLAKQKDEAKGKALEQWLYTNQAEMSRDMVKGGLQEIAQVSGSDYDAEYAKLLPAIREDAALGQKLGVNGTPTFFINGIKLPSLRSAYFDAAIAYALKKAGAAS